MKMYKLNSKEPETWGTEAYNGMIIDEDEVNRLGQEWDTSIDDLMEELEEIDYNQEVVREWKEIGGVLGYDTQRNGDVLLYVMDDGEFEDRYRYEVRENPVITKDEFARNFCEAALRNARYCEEEIESLMDW